jgi:hypothetical protein
MKILCLAITAMAALIVAPHANATDESPVQILDARIADAEHAATAALKAADTICENAGYAMTKQCSDAIGASNDASGFVGYLYEQRSHLTGQPMPSEYACSGKPSLGAPHPDAEGHYSVCPSQL